MTRPLRLEFAGALYHLIARGDRREAIFLDDEDRLLFIDLLRKTGTDRRRAIKYRPDPLFSS
jgi:hypothetical protein